MARRIRAQRWVSAAEIVLPLAALAAIYLTLPPMAASASGRLFAIGLGVLGLSILLGALICALLLAVRAVVRGPAHRARHLRPGP